MIRIHSYREIVVLPKSALTVEEYADTVNISPQHVYKLWRGHKDKKRIISFEIVVFKNKNYILPK